MEKRAEIAPNLPGEQMNTLEFEKQRAIRNLVQAIEYRKTLEWVLLVIEKDVCDRSAIIEEIKRVLNENKMARNSR